MLENPNLFVVGFDLGTSVSRLGSMTNVDKYPIIVRNNLSNESSPVIMSFQTGGKQRLIGEEALGRECTRPATTCGVLKGLVSGTDVESLRRTGINVDASGSVVTIEGHQPFTPAQLLAMYLKRSLAFVSETPGKVAFAVPPSFQEVQRARVVDACAILGFQPQQVVVVDDIDAAAVALHKGRLFAEGTLNVPIAILSIGASYTSVVVFESKEEHAIEILAKAYIPHGSSSIDLALLADVVAQIQAKHKGINLLERPKAYNRLVKEIRKCKEMLSSVEQSQLQIDCLTDDIDVNIKITRDMLEKASQAFVGELQQMLEGLKGKLPPGVVTSRVELIGGGWRTPSIQQVIKKVMGVDTLCFGLDANSSVAQGTTIVGLGAVEIRGAAASATLPLSDEATIAKYKEVEAALQAIDDVDKANEAAKNKFESFLISTKSLLSRCTKNVEAAQQRLDTDETWMYDAPDSCTAAEFLAKLETLQKEVYEICPEIPSVLAKDAEEQAAKDKAMAEAAEQARKEASENADPKSDPQRLRLAQERREQGQALFKQDHLHEATKRFVQSLEALGNLYDLQDPETRKKRDEISLSCYLNLASCHVRLGNWKPAASNATKALEFDPKSAKALYRRGQAHIGLGEYASAREDLKKGLELSGGDASIQAELEKVDKLEADEKDKQKKTFAKMFA